MARPSYSLNVFTWVYLLMIIVGDACPYKECRCFEDVIQCQDLNLRTLPTLVSSDDSWNLYLTLGGNFITNITSGGLPPGLGGIDFEGNPITRVDKDAFNGSEQTLAELRFSGVNLDELPFGLFYLKNLQRLSIVDSQIRQWDISLLFYIGNTLQTLTLVDVGLTSWPSWIQSMTHLSILEFSSAPVSIPDHAFDDLSQVLESITLKNITMTSTRNIFSKLVALRDVTLDNNLISELIQLPDFGNLTTLNLNNNSITDRINLSYALRPVALSLESIYLNSNKLASLPDLSFMTNLDTLSITDNQISNTRLGSVPPNISTLSLDNNKITSISNFMRNGLKLQTVNLGSNYITQILGVDLPSSVTDMDITSNLISELTDTSFPQNSSMTYLSLDNNPLTRISSSAFSNLKQLSYLSIQGSKLTRLPVAIGLTNSLFTVDLSGNAGLVCTCAEKSLRQWVISVSAHILGDCGITSIDYFLTELAGNFITNITSGGLPPGLRGINFEGNPITRVDKDVFNGSEQTLAEFRFSGVNLDELPYALFYLKNLQSLSIVDSQIRQWDISLLFYLGNTLQTLTLVDVGLTSWPSWIQSMTHLSILEFSSAPVSIPDHAFDDLSQVLESITLKNITMTSTRNIFSNLVALRDVTLDNNLISELIQLPDFGNLTTINLNNNSITDRINLSYALRPVALSLEIIYLNSNKLASLPDLSFMTNLDTLSITDNQISNTRLGSVPPNISTLSLDNNKITSISSFTRNGLKLQTVNLGSNYITQILGVDIPSCVTDMDFTSNLISELTETSFPQNSSMTYLSFDNNPLTRISSSAFSNLKKLTYLSIQGSKLTRLPVAIGLMNNLFTVELSGNVGLVCTCEERSLRQWVISASAHILGDCGITSIDFFLTELAVGCSN